MRCLLATCAAIWLALGAIDCGDAPKRLGLRPRAFAETKSGMGATTPPRRRPASRPARTRDRDNDGDHNNDDEGILKYGHPADAADARDSAALVRRYFAAAAGGDGRTACRLLVPFIAETVAEQNGRSAKLRGRTCPVVMSKLFKLHHRLLETKRSSLEVMAVRVEGDKALAILDFPAIPEVRQMVERRVDGKWRLLILLDGILE